jgi:hypothetical protein
MKWMRARVIAGLSVMVAIMVADAYAQGCPELLEWTCPGSASSTAATSEDVRQEKQLSRKKATSAERLRSKPERSAASDTVRKPKSQQTRATESARSAKAAKAARRTGSADPSSDRRLGGNGERQGATMTDQEKKALFQEFLEWEKARRPNDQTR